MSVLRAVLRFHAFLKSTPSRRIFVMRFIGGVSSLASEMPPITDSQSKRDAQNVDWPFTNCGCEYGRRLDRDDVKFHFAARPCRAVLQHDEAMSAYRPS
jgi:hypothetical protein